MIQPLSVYLRGEDLMTSFKIGWPKTLHSPWLPDRLNCRKFVTHFILINDGVLLIQDNQVTNL